jgi:hypothetical protein
MPIVQYSKESIPESIIAGSFTVHWYIDIYYWKQQIPKLLLEDPCIYGSQLLTIFLVAYDPPHSPESKTSNNFDLTAKHNSGNIY